MEADIGIGKVPLAFFFAFKSFISFITEFLFHRILTICVRQKRVEQMGIGAGMVCAILCCITAWQVEVHKLNLVKKEVIICPNDTIPMSVFWLLPEFCLLGLMEGLGDKGFENFIHNNKHLSKSMKGHVSLFSKLVIGFGNFLNIICFLLITSWFQETIAKSHLDKFFLTLTILGSMFLCIFVFVSPMYAHMEALLEEVHSNDQGICCC